jgi:hypothetical protein
LGHLFYESGEYDAAIKEYKQGLEDDPSNIELQKRIQRTLRAKATEAGIPP